MLQFPPLKGPRTAQLQSDTQAPFDLVGGTHFGRYSKISSEQTFNMMISDNALVNFPGFELATVIAPLGNGREIYNSVLLGKMVAVISSGVYLIDPSLTVTHIGNLATSDSNVFIADNFASQIALVDGLNIYIYNYATGVFTTILGIDIGIKPVYITYQDTYFIAEDGASNKWRISQPDEGTQWPIFVGQTTFEGEMQSKTNKCVAGVTVGRSLLIMGQTVTEVWYDVGYGLFPYQRSNFYAIDYGCLSAETIAVGYGRTCWLASNEKSGPAIMVAQDGGEPQQISNDGLDYLFSQLTKPNDSYGFMAKIEGHIIYVITFVTDNYSFVYDFNTQMFFTLTDENMNYFPAKRIAFFDNAYYFVAFNDGNLYRLGSQFTTYNGAQIPRIRICKNIRFGDSARFIPSSLTLTMETGETNPGGPISVGTSPVTRLINRERVDLSISKDGGYIYGNVVSQYLPPSAKHAALINFYNIGASNDLVMKFEFWGFGRFVITGGYMTVNA